MYSGTKKLAEMMKEDQIFSRLKNAVVDNVASMKCGAMTKITGTSYCFVAGTLVATCDGNRPIEEIEIGDVVWAYDGETIDSTRPHPFYVPGEGFKQAGELVAGDQILLLDGSIKTIDKVTAEALETSVAVYNFTVEDWHTYFVGEQKVLVHNTLYCPTASKEKILPSRKGALREAKRDAGIPYNQQPYDIKYVDMTQPDYLGGHVLTDNNGKVIRTREYYYKNIYGEIRVIQENQNTLPI